ncbi:hypothetical protein IT396_03180 [Candidatus Nomurabacteria bacterium]|nr:hypothetical protein [Candidatus Nomurabacteria bacterium]
MTPEQRKNAIATAKYVTERLPKGQLAGDFYLASLDQNDDVLEAIHLILNYHEDGRAHAASIF